MIAARRRLRAGQAGRRELGDGRVVCLTEAEREANRTAVFEAAQGLCKGCGVWAPLKGFRAFAGARLTPAGHAHHRKRRGLGGGTRDDRVENQDWLCAECHKREHEPKKVVPGKREAGFEEWQT